MKHKVILIGCGIMAKQHSARFERVKDRAEISAVVDIERERAQTLSDLLPNHPPVCTCWLKNRWPIPKRSVRP